MSRTAQQDFEDYVARVMAASGADANFDDCFRNIIAAYNWVCAERDTAVRERDLLMLEPNNRLDGYREIGAKCAALEDRLDSMKAERDAARANARVLAHAYAHDTRPPSSVVADSLVYPVYPEAR